MRIFDHARRYHQISKYTFNDIKSTYREMIYESKGIPVKNYKKNMVIPLEKKFDYDTSDLSADFETSSRFGLFYELKPTPVTLSQLSQLLHLSNGVTFIKDFGPKKIFFRAAPSAGACYPIEMYLAVNNVEGVEKGLYYYHPVDHQLVLLKKGEIIENLYHYAYELDFVKKAPFFLLFSNIFSRNEWKYQKRALRYSMLDCGYILQNLNLTASSLGLAANLLGDFKDDEINTLLNFDANDEITLMLAALGIPERPLKTASYTFGMNVTEIDQAMLSDEAQRTFYRKSSHTGPGEGLVTVEVKLPFRKIPAVKKPSHHLIDLPKPMEKFGMSTFRTIENRRSVHNFQRISIDVNDLATLLHFLYQIPSLYNFPAFYTYIVVNDVEKLTNGLYYYHQTDHKLELFKKGTFRGDISYLTLAQDAVFNASVAIFFACNFKELDIFSDRGYRYAHFNIGMASEAVYLVASALNLGVRGIGNFFDEELSAFFNLDLPDEYVLGGVVVGRK